MTVATGLRVLDYGDQALLLDFDSTAEVLAWADALRDADLLGVVDLVSASRTVLIKLESRRYLPRIRQHIEELHPGASIAVEPPTVADVVIEVVYDGADLADVTAHPGLDEAGVVAAHTGTPWRGAWGWRTSSVVTRDCTSYGGTRRAPRCPPVPWGLPASSAASIHANPPAAGR